MKHKRGASASMQRYADAMNWFEMRDRQMGYARSHKHIDRSRRETANSVKRALRCHRSGMRALDEARKYRYKEPVL